MLYVRTGKVDASADTKIEAFVFTVRGGIFCPCFVRVACRFSFLVRMWKVMARVPVYITTDYYGRLIARTGHVLQYYVRVSLASL